MSLSFFDALPDVAGVLLVNAAMASGLVLLLLLARRVGAAPGVVHVLGLLVLLKLVTPPLVSVELPVLAAPPAAREAPVESPLFRSPLPFAEPALPELSLAPPPHLEALGEPALLPPLEARPAVESPAPGTGWSWVQWLLFIWIAGAMVSYGRALMGMLRFRRLLSYASPPPPEVVALQARLARRLGLRRVPEIRLLPATVAPMVWSMGRRTWLVIPTRLWERIEPAERAALVAHELAHVLRRDHWVRRLELLVGGLYWWLPPLWWSRRAMRQAEEECCDAWVCWALRGDERAYADALVRTIDFLSGSPSPLPPAASGLGDPGGLKRRLTMILQKRSRASSPARSRRLALILGAVALPFFPSFAQQAPEAPPSPVAVEAEPAETAPEPPAPVVTNPGEAPYGVARAAQPAPGDNPFGVATGTAPRARGSNSVFGIASTGPVAPRPTQNPLGGVARGPAAPRVADKPFGLALAEASSPQEAEDLIKQLRNKIAQTKDRMASFSAKLRRLEGSGKADEVAKMRRQLARTESRLASLVNDLETRVADREARRAAVEADRAAERRARGARRGGRRGRGRSNANAEAARALDLARANEAMERSLRNAQRAADEARAQAERAMQRAEMEMQRAAELRDRAERRMVEVRDRAEEARRHAEVEHWNEQGRRRGGRGSGRRLPNTQEAKDRRIEDLERACAELTERLAAMQDELRVLRGERKSAGRRGGRGSRRGR